MNLLFLSQQALDQSYHLTHYGVLNSPIKVLQIGEGNFLRGFFDWMLHEARKQGRYDGSIAVVQPRPSGAPNIEALAQQDGLYTLVMRGLQQGNIVERKEIISVFREVFDPYTNWDRFIALADEPELRFVVSNTTEAGLVYSAETLVEGKPIQSYPGKLTQFLYRRYLTYSGDPSRGLICLPCELLERNGDTLREYVLRYCEDWRLPGPFIQWVEQHNRFLNSLVDRIVTGYPSEQQAQRWFQEWGYNDHLLTTAEPYHLWVIEGEPQLAEELPFAQAGLNVWWVNDLKPYQQRKVRILNGAHTFMALLGILQGFTEVRLAMEDERLGGLIRRTVEQEIVSTMPYNQVSLLHYAGEVYERFLNPFIQHRLSDIAMNSLSKFKTRLLPSLIYELDRNPQVLPVGLTTAFASLLRYYQITKRDGEYWGTTFAGEQYQLRDDPTLLEKMAYIWAKYHDQSLNKIEVISELLACTELWDTDLNKKCHYLAENITSIMDSWE